MLRPLGQTTATPVPAVAQQPAPSSTSTDPAPQSDTATLTAGAKKSRWTREKCDHVANRGSLLGLGMFVAGAVAAVTLPVTASVGLLAAGAVAVGGILVAAGSIVAANVFYPGPHSGRTSSDDNAALALSTMALSLTTMNTMNSFRS